MAPKNEKTAPKLGEDIPTLEKRALDWGHNILTTENLAPDWGKILPDVHKRAPDLRHNIPTSENLAPVLREDSAHCA